MDVNYDRIARSYDRYRKAGGPYIRVLARAAARCGARRALELGSGTGNSAAAFLEAHPCRLAGLEPSPGMLARAVSKGLPVEWVRGRAEAIPLADGAVDFVFACYVLHHVRSLDAVFQECARILGAGTAAFVTAPHDFIRRHPLNRYFPSFAAVDCARFPAEEEVRAALARAGFRDIACERVEGDPTVFDRHYVDRVAGKFVSTLDLVPPDEFEAGLARLRRDVEQRAQPLVEGPWEALVIAGRK